MQHSNRALVQEHFKGWPAYVLRQGALTLSLVPAVGGRLMGVAFGAHQLCFVHPQLEGRTYAGNTADWAALCGDWDFPLWGGGKTWVAPESAWPGGAPHRDLDSLAWAVQDAWCDDRSMGVELQSPVCSMTGLQITRRLNLPANDSAWMVEHSLTNGGNLSIPCGLWDVLMLQRPGTVLLPLTATDTATAVVSLPHMEPLGALLQDGVVEQSDTQATIHCTKARAFKCGVQSKGGRVLVDFAPWGLRYARHSFVDLRLPYAHGHPVEVFNAPRLDYFEVETHSPLQQLLPGECLRYTIHERVDALTGAAQQPSALSEKEIT